LPVLLRGLLRRDDRRLGKHVAAVTVRNQTRLELIASATLSAGWAP